MLWIYQNLLLNVCKFSKTSEESRIWVYGAQDIISSENQELISDKIFAFLSNWSHHGKPLTSSFIFY